MKTIGVLTPFADGFYFTGMLQGIHEAAAEHGVRVICFQTMDANYERVTYDRLLADDYIDGWIVIYNALDDPDFIARVESRDRPVVTTPHHGGFYASTVIETDNELGGYEATKHLIAHGYRSIACVYSPHNAETVQRYDGWRRAHEEAGLVPDPRLAYAVEALAERSGRDAGRRMLELGVPFEALFASTDQLAIGVLDVLQSGGMRVPEDLAVIGFDNTNHIERLMLSSVDQSLAQRGRLMLKTVLRRIAGEPLSGERIVMQPELILRRSCGCRSGEAVDDIRQLYDDGLEAIEYLTGIIERNRRIGRDLVRSHADKIMDLSWLSSTTFRWGGLALWCGERELSIESVYAADDVRAVRIGERYRESQFPPPSLFEIVRPDESLTVHPIKTDERDLGFMVLIGRNYEKMRTTNYHHDTMTHSLDLLAYALEREAMFDDARKREQRLEIVSSTTNDGIFEWDIETDLMTWNRRISSILELEGTSMSFEQFTRSVDPQHRRQLARSIGEHFKSGKPFEQEFRMRKNNGESIWVAAAGEAIRRPDGSLERMIGSIRDITERKQAEERIRYLAFHDPLTGLVNRRSIYDSITSRIQRSRQPFAVILFDLDRFKIINDSLGHTIGDKLLQRIAVLLQRLARPQDIVARLGGDEFIMLCPILVEREEATAIAERAIALLQERQSIEGHAVYVTCSIGISYYPDHGTDRETLIKHADIAMYEAKQGGKNGVRAYDEFMSREAMRRMTLESSLRKALDNGEFILHYQPQLDLATERIIGMEALIRWQSPELGLVPPIDFIPLAEETGLIIPISEWVLRQACLDNMELIAQGMPPLFVSVNISARHFTVPDFVETLLRIVEETGLPTNLLCLEITETVAIQDVELTIRQLRALIDKGIRIALDDFGVGNSSLSLLRQLPLAILKVDRTFVSDVTSNASQKSILTAIVGLAQGLQLASCGEGVETDEDLRLLQQMGCSHAQGYYICKPLPIGRFRSFFESFELPRLPL